MRRQALQTWRLVLVGLSFVLGTTHIALALRQDPVNDGDKQQAALQAFLHSTQAHQRQPHPHGTWTQTAWAWLTSAKQQNQADITKLQTQRHTQIQPQQYHDTLQPQQQTDHGDPQEQFSRDQQHIQPHHDSKANGRQDEPDWPWYPLPGDQGAAIQTEIDRIQSRAGRKLQAALPLPHEWPGYLLPERERHLGVAYPGDWGRLRAALARYKRTRNLTIGVVGGSISAGAGAYDSQSWVEWLEDWLGLVYNGTRDASTAHEAIGDPRVRVANGAVPGTYSSYMSVCYNKHVPQDVDIVIVEYALNDETMGAADRYDNLIRRAFERLIRKLLSYPNQPAVILLNAYAWVQADKVKRYDGLFYAGADADFFEYASYYQLPMLSVKTAAWKLMQQGVPGFMVNRTRGSNKGTLEPPEIDKDLKHNMFYWDFIHPNGDTGHRVMADLVVHLLAHSEKSLLRRPWSDAEEKRVKMRGQLPEPMIKGNWESQSDKCFVGETLHEIVLKPESIDPNIPQFTWMNDQPPGRREKWGYVSTERGARIQFKVDARTSSYRRIQAGVHMRYPVGQVAIEIAYLRSYEGMGIAEINCVAGCICINTRWDSLDVERKASLVSLFELKVTMHQECIIEVINLGESSSKTDNKQTKVKITGLMISDEGAEMEELENKDLKSFQALEFVTSGLRPNQSFEIKNTWR